MDDPSEESRGRADYEIGYGKPPQHGQFRKGQSGNAKGRPAHSKNLLTLLNEALDERVIVKEGGRRRKVSKRQVLITQMINKAVAADLKAIGMLLVLMQNSAFSEHASNAAAEGLSDADRKVLQSLKERLALSSSHEA